MEIEKEHLLASKRYRERLSRKQSRDSYLVRRFKDFFPFFLLKFAYEESVERSIEREREKEEGREKKERKSRFDVPRFFFARFIFHATLRPGVCSNTVTQKNSGAKRPPEYEKLNGFVSSNVYFVFLCPVRSDTFQEATVANVVCMSGKS